MERMFEIDALLTEVREGGNKVLVVLVSSVCDSPENASTEPYVGEHIRLIKNGDGGLGIEQDPHGVDCRNNVLCEHETMVKKGGSRRSSGTGSVLGGAIAIEVSCAVAPVTDNSVMQNSICAWDGGSSLDKCHGSAVLDGPNGQASTGRVCHVSGAAVSIAISENSVGGRMSFTSKL